MPDRKILDASIYIEGSVASITLFNRTGHVEGFSLAGVTPTAVIHLNGNTTYSIDLPINDSDLDVEVRHGSKFGRLISSAAIRSRST